jgi:hypothetical protein
MTEMQKALKERAWRVRVGAEVDRFLPTLRAGKMLVYPKGSDLGLFNAVCAGIVRKCRSIGLRIETQESADKFMAILSVKKRAA